MSRFRMVTALAAVVSLAFAGVALAAVSKVTGGTTQITASAAAQAVLTANHITVTPIAPATASGTTFTFPISSGSLNTQNNHGVIHHKGGLTLSNGTKDVKLRDLTIVSTRKGVSIDARVRGRTIRACDRTGRHHLIRHCVRIETWNIARIATVTGVTVSNGTATGTVDISATTARLINRLAGKTVASAGEPLGTGTVAPTLK